MLDLLRVRFDELERQRAALLGRLRPLSDGQLAHVPARGGWSLTGVVHHLVLVEEGSVQFLLTKPPRPASARRLADRVRWELVCLGLRTPVRVRAPTALVVPTTDATLDELVPRWDAARERLAEYLERFEPEALRHIVFKHPLGGPLDVLESLRFIRLHIAHHEHQIARIRRDPGFPAPAPREPARAGA